MNNDQRAKADSDDSRLAMISSVDSPVEEQSGREQDDRGIERMEAAAQQEQRHVLPDPSPEQSEIIRAIHANNCVTVEACAGSGKTTCMLQVAASLPGWRNVLIVTYNRSLADECKERIQKLSLGDSTKCYTIHGLASRFAGRSCNDDHKLMQQLDRWDRDLDLNPVHPFPLDLIMIDEAQDLRPLFHKVLSRIFRLQNDGGKQLCLVGDPKQLLYDFPTYGEDKASASFFLQPETYWGQFTQNRKWVHLPLSVSYRLTPNIASFCNLFWGTSMVGGNTAIPNVPVEYIIKYPYPNSKERDDPDKLKTSFLAGIIDQHGPENVLFLAQSIKKAELPIRVHVNELMKIKDSTTGLQKYNFHIKESVRGFEGTPDWNNKVRVWTFCGSKGCEADVVVVFGLDIYARPQALNQIGVALSRARKRLLVIHGKKYSEGACLAMPYYPILGDCPTGMDQHVVRFGKDNSEEIKLTVPAIEPRSDSALCGPQTYAKRSDLTKEALAKFAESGVIHINHCSASSGSTMPETRGAPRKQLNQVYIASEFNYFSASAETKFLHYGHWTKIGVGNENKVGNSPSNGDDGFQDTRINYETNVEFASTTEDVSALYGEAVTYMLQWDLCKFVPNIETVVSNGILRLHPHVKYSEKEIREYMRSMCCEELTPKDGETLRQEFAATKGEIAGKDLIPILNTRVFIKKKREFVVEGGLVNEVAFPVKAVERKNDDDDNQLTEFLPQIKAIYESESSSKKPWHWIYLGTCVSLWLNCSPLVSCPMTLAIQLLTILSNCFFVLWNFSANAVMAFSNYHEKFRQIGTDPNSYESWVHSEALLCGLERLRDLMKRISPSSNLGVDNDNGNDSNVGGSTRSMELACSFESELSVDFAQNDCIQERNNLTTIVGVAGVCDWINENVHRCTTKEVEHDVDLLEIKFVHHLSNVHRLQVLAYLALYALKVSDMENHVGSNEDDNFHTEKRKDKGEVECLKGMLYNARTGEMEICSIKAKDAMGFLLDISQFKYNGKNRKDIECEQKSILPKKQIDDEVSWLPKRKIPKKKLLKNTGKSYYAALCVDDDDESKSSIQETVSDSIKSLRTKESPGTYRSDKRRKKILDMATEEGTNDDPIILD